MKITVLAGGVGGARFLLGVRHLLGFTPFPAQTVEPEKPIPTENTNASEQISKFHKNFRHTVTTIVNVGDDAWMHGVRICPDLDTCMYTLGGGVDPERGWGHKDESFNAKAEFEAYKAEPTWFWLGDKDIATHLIRTQMLSAGYPLSQVTEALCKRWQPGVRLLPATDERHETHVIVDAPASDINENQTSDNHDETAKTAIHFQQWWVKYKANIPTHGFVQVGDDHKKPAPGVLAAIAEADIIFLSPSNPVVSIGAILSVPGIRAALRETKAKIIGYSPVIGGRPLRGMAEVCLSVENYGSSATEVARYYGFRKNNGLLDGWLVAPEDIQQFTPHWLTQHNIDASAIRGIPLIMSDEQTTARMVQQGIELAGMKWN